MSIPIYDSWDTSYKSIFGTLKRAEDCKFRLRLPPDTAGEPVLVIYRLGFKVKFVPMRRVESEDDTRVFETSYSPNFVGVHHYYFSVLERGERLYIKRENAHIGSFEGNELFQLTVYDNGFTAPDFIKGGIMYQIFPDRFYKSGKHHENVPSDRIMREDWGAIPSYIPSSQGRYNNDYFGGDLAGIMEKLPYLYELGVTCIYLNPIFEAHENHRYNTAD
ncbi:MAG TPA: alpha-amylase family glycosyl hydrolase, partial [Oscillospiraceae bacterium]|nr:alpha-amylase family glycosyl hydrolase [Oscillospiraceae bacterium]